MILTALKSKNKPHYHLKPTRVGNLNCCYFFRHFRDPLFIFYFGTCRNLSTPYVHEFAATYSNRYTLFFRFFFEGGVSPEGRVRGFEDGSSTLNLLTWFSARFIHIINHERSIKLGYLECIKSSVARASGFWVASYGETQRAMSAVVIFGHTPWFQTGDSSGIGSLSGRREVIANVYFKRWQS